MKTDVIFDMETQDPDDVLTLCLLCTHPNVNLRAVTITPGSNEQVGVVRHILRKTGRTEIPVGAYSPAYEKECVSFFHYKWLGEIPPESPDGEGWEIMVDTLANYPDAVLLTGAPLKNLRGFPDDVILKKWVAQGGFAGDNVVPEAYRLDKFKGMETCPTFNFNGDPKTALKALAADNILERRLVSKNVCHGVVYDMEMDAIVSAIPNKHPGLALLCQGMKRYLKKRPMGKKFHDPLAACVLIDERVCEFRQVELYRKRGGFGSKLADDSRTFISINYDRERFLEVLTRC